MTLGKLYASIDCFRCMTLGKLDASEDCVSAVIPGTAAASPRPETTVPPLGWTQEQHGKGLISFLAAW
jgi:hypothetical protein